MTEPKRLLDSADRGFAERLLASSVADRPSGAARRRALGVAAAVASASAVGTASAVTTGALVKGALVWALVGGASGALVSVSVAKVAAHFETRSPRAAMIINAQPSRATPTHQLVVHTDSGPTRAGGRAPLPVVEDESAESGQVPATEAEARSVAEPQPIHSARAAQHDAPSTPARSGTTRATLGMSAHSSAQAASGSQLPALPSSTPAPVPALHDVEDELAWLDQARRRLAAGDAGGALTRISAYQSVFPRGHFQPEALALRAEALAARGERALAQLAAARFLATAPSHPLAARMRALVDASADPQRDRSN